MVGSVLFSNINWVFDVTANWMVLRRQFLVRIQYLNTAPCDSNTTRSHWLFRPATLESNRRLWSFIADRVWAAPRPAGTDRVLPRGLPGRATEPRWGAGMMPMLTMATQVSAHAGYGRCRRPRITIEPLIEWFYAPDAGEQVRGGQRVQLRDHRSL